MSELVSITLTRDSWGAIQGVLLEATVRMDREGEHDEARRVLDKLVPVLAWAAGPKLAATEAAVREHIGSYVTEGVRTAARALVRRLPET